jgi:hypothetical protein
MRAGARGHHSSRQGRSSAGTMLGVATCEASALGRGWVYVPSAYAWHQWAPAVPIGAHGAPRRGRGWLEAIGGKAPLMAWRRRMWPGALSVETALPTLSIVGRRGTLVRAALMRSQIAAANDWRLGAAGAVGQRLLVALPVYNVGGGGW